VEPPSKQVSQLYKGARTGRQGQAGHFGQNTSGKEYQQKGKQNIVFITIHNSELYRRDYICTRAPLITGQPAVKELEQGDKIKQATAARTPSDKEY
jgi:hypothetical protein